MRKLAGVVLAAGLVLAGPGAAQDRTETLADIRQELSVLYVEIQRLKTELSTTGAVGGVVTGGSVLDRVNAIEGELTRLIARTEELEFRIDRIVTDGTNRIGDLEFRLVELEGGDISALGETTTLGGGDAPTGPAPTTAPVTPEGGSQLAIGEQADFDAAQAAFDSGDYAGAAEKFAAFTETYPGGPMSGQAHYQRGEALAVLGQTKEAGRAYLAAFTADPNGARAPEALFKLGQSLGDLGQVSEACVTLNEVGVRFPGSSAWADAQLAMQELGCN